MNGIYNIINNIMADQRTDLDTSRNSQADIDIEDGIISINIFYDKKVRNV